MSKCHVPMSYLPFIPETAFCPGASSTPLHWCLIMTLWSRLAFSGNCDNMALLTFKTEICIRSFKNKTLSGLTESNPFFLSLIGLLKSRLSSKRVHWLLGFTVLERPLCHMSFVSNWSHKRNKVENKKGGACDAQHMTAWNICTTLKLPTGPMATDECVPSEPFESRQCAVTKEEVHVGSTHLNSEQWQWTAVSTSNEKQVETWLDSIAKQKHYTMKWSSLQGPSMPWNDALPQIDVSLIWWSSTCNAQDLTKMREITQMKLNSSSISLSSQRNTLSIYKAGNFLANLPVENCELQSYRISMLWILHHLGHCLRPVRRGSIHWQHA